jgi:hypothetical protein
MKQSLKPQKGVNQRSKLHRKMCNYTHKLGIFTLCIDLDRRSMKITACANLDVRRDVCSAQCYCVGVCNNRA